MWFKEIEELLKKEKPKELPLRDFTPSAVGVPLSVRKGNLSLTFILRTMKVNHPGQIGFPGGQYETKDGTLYNTVLREVEEELGIKKELIYLLGQLSDQTTPTKFWIRPFVILIPGNIEYKPENKIEVEKVLSIPILNFKKTIGFYGVEFWESNTRIWGVTARIMEELFRKINLKV
jgi:8-oxo-dGTP pyrophosphatase MutT (NUDIX family)